MNGHVDDVAAKAVSLLDVTEFIRRNIDGLYDKLEESDRLAAGSPMNDDVMFVALSLPAVQGIIQFASSRKDLDVAMKWVKDHWKDKSHDPDPMSILSALTLIYIVEEGVKRYEQDAERKKTWSRIRGRLGALKDEAQKVRPAKTA